MNLFYRIFISLLAVSVCSAEIITRNFQLTENQVVNVENGTIRSLSRDSLKACGKIQYDFVFSPIGEWLASDCSCGGTIYGIVTNNPISVIYNTNSSFFSSAIDTTDVSVVKPRPLDSIWWHCPHYRIHIPFFTQPCDCPWTPPVKNWNLGKTISGNFYLCRIDSTFELHDNPREYGHAFITCILQTDGSLDFSKAFESSAFNSSKKGNQIINRHNSAILKIVTSEIADKNGSIYDIQGKRIDKPIFRASQGNSIKLYILAK